MLICEAFYDRVHNTKPREKTDVSFQEMPQATMQTVEKLFLIPGLHFIMRVVSLETGQSILNGFYGLIPQVTIPYIDVRVARLDAYEASGRTRRPKRFQNPSSDEAGIISAVSCLIDFDRLRGGQYKNETVANILANYHYMYRSC